jgi:FlaA1/EpsC-like NDP-sugar epimerase
VTGCWTGRQSALRVLLGGRRAADDQERAGRSRRAMTRVVLVTGANRGIGRELARQLVVRGDTVVLTARDLA